MASPSAAFAALQHVATAALRRPVPPARVCAQCQRRLLSASARLDSGHNRWSKIRHEKGAADAKRNAQRGAFSKQLTLYSKLHGGDPATNAQLAAVVAIAKKAGMPKSSIDVAIARGQGQSSSGAALESMTLEVMMPPGVAMVIDIETEGKGRVLQDLRLLVKKQGGTVTPTMFNFSRLGRTVHQLKAAGGEAAQDFDDVFMKAVEAGAEDVEQDEENNVIVWTQPNVTHQAAQGLSAELKSEILSSEIIWTPAADKVPLDDEEAAKALNTFLAALQDYSDVQAVYANAEKGTISQELWEAIEDNLDS